MGKKNTVTTFLDTPNDAAGLFTDCSFLYSDYDEMLDDMAKFCHANAVQAGWWHELASNPKYFIKSELNFGERIALMHSELSEALEGFRKNKMCDKPGLEDLTMVEEEFADTLIRIFDTAGAMQLRLGEAFKRKLIYNQTREDHKIEVRNAEGGKAF